MISYGDKINTSIETEGRGIPTGDIGIDKKKIWTTGLGTCIFLCIRTKNCYIGWHFAADYNMYNVNMDRVKAVLDSVKDVIDVFLVKGSDRDDDFKLKSDCRTLQYRPAMRNLTTLSRSFLMEYLDQYPWFKQVIFVKSVKYYKEFISFGDGLPKPITLRNDELFDDICIVDGGKMI